MPSTRSRNRVVAGGRRLPKPAIRAAVGSIGRARARLAGRRVLVVGGRGFLGSALCEALTGFGAVVSAAVRDGAEATRGAVHCVSAELSHGAAARAVVSDVRPDIVYLLASHGVGSPELANVFPCVADDFLANVNVMTAAAEHGCARIVVAASMEEPAEARAIPGSPYAAAKWATTGYARMFHDLYGAPIVIARPFMTYGPRQRTHKIIPYSILSFLRGESPVLSSGRRLVDWVYVDDITRGLVAAGTQPGIDGGEFDLGSGRRVSIRSVVERLARLTGSAVSPRFGGLADRPARRPWRADTITTLARLGWKAEITLDEGLRRTVDWYARNHAERPPAR